VGTIANGQIMSMRQIAIDIMKAHPDQPKGEVVQLISKSIGRSPGEARSFYDYIVKNGLAQGEGTVHSLPHEKPRSYLEAIKMLRDHLGVANSNGEAIIQLMRDLSNFDAIGRTATSKTLKRYNRCVSQKAYDWISHCSSFDQWHEATTNEHSAPINIMLKWIIERSPSITDEEIEQIFHDNPVCTVLKDPENDLLRKLGYHSSGTRRARYAAAGIEIIYLSKDPW
jgi:hypothetical protein